MQVAQLQRNNKVLGTKLRRCGGSKRKGDSAKAKEITSPAPHTWEEQLATPVPRVEASPIQPTTTVHEAARSAPAQPEAREVEQTADPQRVAGLTEWHQQENATEHSQVTDDPLTQEYLNVLFDGLGYA